jgi:subtilase family serine protease
VIRKLSVFVLALAAIVSSAAIASQAQTQSLMTRHVRDEVASGVAPAIGRLPANQSMRIVLVLPRRNQAELDQFLKDVYDRSSSSYRQFLTVEQFTEKFGPTREDYETVKSFAKANGLKVVGEARNRQIVQVTGSVRNIEKALHVTMGLYQHPTENRTFFGPDREPTTDMSVRLWSVGGLDNYSTPKSQLVRRDPKTVSAEDAGSNATTGSGPSKSFLGSDMRAAYYGGTALTGTGQSLGLFELIGTDLADLTTYFTNVHQTNNVPVTLLSVDGQNVSCVDNSAGGFCDDTEQTLDMTQAIGMAPGLSSLVMYIGTGALSGQTVDDAGIFNAMATAKPLNAQLSSSWAWRPADPTVDDPFFQEFAAQGQNLFDAAGDSGKWTKNIFVWPADDPFLTSVGGTDLDTSSAGGPWASETGWPDSGGGISPNSFAIPSWQTVAAAGCTSCSQTLRNGPDVSANANFTFYVCADQTTCSANEFGGTSFAAPMWAGFLALINQQAVANGQPTLGFINPALYDILESSSYTTDFHDITSGSNGFSATVGFDLVTGIGSPNGQPLIDALAPASSSASFTLSASPTAVSAAQGGKVTSKITAAISGGFDAAIALTASGQPTGVTVAFNPATIAAPGAGTVIVGFTVASTTTPGVYPITVKGTGGGVTATTTVTLTVTGTTGADFALTASPTTVTVKQGSSGTSTITSKISGGFNAAVTLSASPASVATFGTNPIPAPGSGTSVLTLKVPSTAPVGTKTITITGTGGGKTHTTTVKLTITAK